MSTTTTHSRRARKVLAAAVMAGSALLTAQTSTAAVDLPAGARLIAPIVVPEGRGGMAIGERGVWVRSDNRATLTRIDPRTNAVVATLSIRAGTGEAAAGDGAVWLSNTDADTVTRVDPRTNTVVATIRVGPRPGGIAVSPDAVWVANVGGPSVSRIDPATNRVVATIRVGPARSCCSEHMAVTADHGAIWASVPTMSSVVRIDPATNEVADHATVAQQPCGFLAAEAGAVWSAGGGCGDVVTRIDRRTAAVGPTIEEPHPVGLALGFGSLWVAVLGAQRLDRVDPHDGRIVGRLELGGFPVRVAVGFGSVWVHDDGGRVLRITPHAGSGPR